MVSRYGEPLWENSEHRSQSNPYDTVVRTVIILRVTVHSTRQYTTIVRTKQRQVQRCSKRIFCNSQACLLAYSTSHREKLLTSLCEWLWAQWHRKWIMSKRSISWAWVDMMTTPTTATITKPLKGSMDSEGVIIGGAALTIDYELEASPYELLQYESQRHMPKSLCMLATKFQDQIRESDVKKFDGNLKWPIRSKNSIWKTFAKRSRQESSTLGSNLFSMGRRKLTPRRW
jgi:hypothetical protein